MNLREQVLQFIHNPFPLWENALTKRLVEHKWEDLKKQGFSNIIDYSTAGIWLSESSLKTGGKRPIPQSDFHLEMPSPNLKSFYEENGLDLLSENEIEKSEAISKLSRAISVFELIEPAYKCLTNLVGAIQLLRQPEPEVDLSYSHPQIPFSIFISLCEDDSLISNLRVAESILHEAMHLKLTLIEGIIPLVDFHSSEMYYSPWKNENRPLRGVIHGLFVFLSIERFYIELQRRKVFLDASDYFTERIAEIKSEVLLLRGLEKNSSFTEAGASLATCLLPLN